MSEKLEPELKEIKHSPRSLLGKVFNPEAEKILKASKQERGAALEKFKKEWVEQKEGIATMQETLTKIIRENPDAPLEKLCKAAADINLALDLKLTDQQKEITELVLEKYVEKHNKIKETREKYPNDRELFKALFGRYPKEKIEVIKSPIILYFRVYLNDYAYIHSGAFLRKESLSRDEINLADQSDGFPLPWVNYLTSELDGVVVLEKVHGENNTKIIMSHEEQHIINQLFQKTFQESQIEEGKIKIDIKRIKFFAGRLRSARTDDKRQSLLTDCFSLIRDEVFSEMGRDEIFAYLQEDKHKHKSPLEIYEILTKSKNQNGIYDFFEEKKKKIFKPFKKSGIYKQYSLLIKNTAEEVLKNQYHQLLKNGIEAVEDLQKYGYSNDKIIAFLMNESLTKWPKVVERLLGAKK